MSRASVDQAVTTSLDEQLTTLLERGYPDLAGLTVDSFTALVSALRPVADELAGQDTPYHLVVGPRLVTAEHAIAAAVWQGRAGFTSMDTDDLARFVPLPDLAVPDAPVYLVTGVETGTELHGVTPDDALPRVLARGRSPLTLHEGLALVTHDPDVLRRETAFQMMGSRCGDKRVTGIWVSARKPRLGWCWGGNQHGWLGMASCSGRRTAAA